MKIAYLLHRFPYLTETFIMREIDWMSRQGVEVEIFSLLPPKDTVVHEQAKALLPYTHYSPFLSWAVLKAQVHFLRRSLGRYLRAITRLVEQTYREPKVLLLALALFPKSVYFVQQMEMLGIEHIHVHFVWLGALAAGIAADLIGSTFSVNPHAFDLFERNQRDVRSTLENATRISTISDYNRTYIAALCPDVRCDEIEIIHCGIDTELFRPVAKSRRNHPLQILSVGRLIEKKGHEYLIDACALLAQRGIPFQCLIVGDGPRKAALQERIVQHGLQEQVVLLGALGQEQIVQQYGKSDIFALACVQAQTGDRDGIPVVLMEAMACALPVIATPVTGIPELVRAGETGLLVEERDEVGLADALELLIVDADLRQRLGQAARQTILNEFEIQQNVTKLAAIFQRISKQETSRVASQATVQD